ncbi:MAG: hypothetical protein A2X35_10535 [Elusimicrobia bacterium GWA2_61_42]|nr:MAG: hypothetical protein A2X35_10535 [Elusimicrobia bacterium GWA2_61_42]OGR74697.1 MAG: hypothetical protein A2X38_02500 [Elusimicrobia bacterium GWC2_61_25]
MRAAFQKILLVALGLAVGLVLAESGLRLYGAYYRLSRASGAPPAGTIKILCAGDSFTYGMGAPADFGYPGHLQRLLDSKYGAGAYSVINAGVPGQNSSELADSIDFLLAAHRPHFLLVLTGANNYNLRGSNFFLFAPQELSAARNAALKADAFLSRLKTYKFFKLGAKLLLSRGRAGAYSPPPCSPAAQKALDAAMAQNDGKDFKAAAAIMEKALLKDGNCAELHFQAGRMLFYFRDFPAAFDHFRKGRETDPRHPFVNIFLSQEIPLLRPEVSGLALDKLLRHDLDLVLEAARRSGTAALIQTYPFATDSRRDWIRKASAAPFIDHHTVFLPLLAGEKHRQYLSGDEPDLLASHPNSAGYELMAANIYAAAKALALLPPPVLPAR